jgi:hypothetical protein
MRFIRAQLRTGWKRMAGSNWIATREGLRPEMDDKRWIPSGDGSRPDMYRNRIWMDDRRWMTGDGSQEMDHGRRMTINLLPFYEDIVVMRVIPFSKSLTLISSYEVTIERRYADIRCTGGMARYRALFRAPSKDIELNSYMPEFQCRIRSRIRSRVTATMPIPHKPYKINLWRSNDL